jgi:subtilisin family serine protease
VRDRWRVAVIDSGLDDSGIPRGLARIPIASRRFVDNGREVLTTSVESDPIGHGSDVYGIICGASCTTDLLVGQVLDHRGAATAAAVAAAITWSVDTGANLIHMSLGLREDRHVLAAAVALAVGAGCIVVASTPARGESTFPARYPQVIRATGDARCQRDEISELSSAQADFGACPRHVRSHDSAIGPGPARFGGASLGAAHLTRFLVDRVAPGSGVTAVRAQLCKMARYHGIEVKLEA